MKSLSLIVCKIFAKNYIFNVWPWPQVKGHGTKWKPINDFLYVFNTNGVSISCIFEIFEKKSIWPFAKVMTPYKSLFMISYMSIIHMESLSLMNFKIFAKISFLTFDLCPRSKVMAPNESPYMISDMFIHYTCNTNAVYLSWILR